MNLIYLGREISFLRWVISVINFYRSLKHSLPIAFQFNKKLMHSRNFLVFSDLVRFLCSVLLNCNVMWLNIYFE